MLVTLLAVTMILPAGVMAVDNSQAPLKEALRNRRRESQVATGTYGTTSVQYALIDNGVITVSGQEGINDMEGKKPLTKDTMYAIGSTSKVFTAAR